MCIWMSLSFFTYFCEKEESWMFLWLCKALPLLSMLSCSVVLLCLSLSAFSAKPRRGPRKQRSHGVMKTCGRRWKLPLRQPYLQWIKEGKKTVEGRINSGLPAKFRPGDEVTFFGGPHSIQVQVVQVDSYKSFQDMLQAISVVKCLPDYADRPIDDAVRLYKSFPGYEDKESKHGVLAIHIKCLP